MSMWELTLSPLELIARSVLIYVLFLVTLRLAGKRELGQFTIVDLSFVLLAANALQPAITGPDASLTGALIIVVTMFIVNRIVAMARTRSVRFRRLIDYAPAILAEDGRWLEPAINREGLSLDDLEATIREHGLEDIKEVKQIVLEHDGSLSVVPKSGGMVQLRARQRRYHHRAPASQ
jgi:uncharacterized membrane protein YcaP (DUF421 family)